MSVFLGFFFFEGFEAQMGGFGAFLRGVLGKVVVLVWCFCGEFVVDCVVFVDR
jgi:hypothetical protein